MGSHMKKAIFEEQTAKALKKWQKAAKARKKLRIKTSSASGGGVGSGGDGSVNSGFMSSETTPSRGTSPLHLLHSHKNRSNQYDLESVLNSPTRSYQSDTDLSDIEQDHASPSTSTTDSSLPPPIPIPHHQFILRNDHHEPHSGDFSFVKL